MRCRVGRVNALWVESEEGMGEDVLDRPGELMEDEYKCQ